MPPAAALAFLTVHRASVRALAADHYPPEVIDAWAPLPVTREEAERLGAGGEELRWVADRAGTVIGIGALDLGKGELSALYVAPDHVGAGVGTALLAAIERAAAQAGLSRLETDASLNAESFYAARGYRVVGPTLHRLAAGPEMDAVRMAKVLAIPTACI
jgi:putative acetyltransferase